MSKSITLTDDQLETIADALGILFQEDERNPELFYGVMPNDTMPRMTVTGAPCISVSSGIETPAGTSGAGDNRPDTLKLMQDLDTDTRAYNLIAAYPAVAQNAAGTVKLYRSLGRRKGGRPAKYWLKGLTPNRINFTAHTEAEALARANELVAEHRPLPDVDFTPRADFQYPERREQVTRAKRSEFVEEFI